jgi:hypothetical protein
MEVHVVMARLEMQFAQWMENVVVSMDTAVHQLCIAITKQLHLHQ